MITPENTDTDFERLLLAISRISPRNPQKQITYSPQKASTRLSARKALLSLQEIIPVEDAEGRICAAPSVSCPPAVPIVISGERITEEDVKRFTQYGIDRVTVVKEKHL